MLVTFITHFRLYPDIRAYFLDLVSMNFIQKFDMDLFYLQALVWLAVLTVPCVHTFVMRYPPGFFENLFEDSKLSTTEVNLEVTPEVTTEVATQVTTPEVTTEVTPDLKANATTDAPIEFVSEKILEDRKIMKHLAWIIGYLDIRMK